MRIDVSIPSNQTIFSIERVALVDEAVSLWNFSFVLYYKVYTVKSDDRNAAYAIHHGREIRER